MHPFYLFIYLFKIYLQLTVNKKKKKYLAYLKTMLVYVNFQL